MRNLLWDRVSAERQDHPRVHRLPRHDPYEFDPPSPLQIFTRLGVLLMIALAFGLVAELLARLAPVIGGHRTTSGDGPARRHGRPLARTRQSQ